MHEEVLRAPLSQLAEQAREHGIRGEVTVDVRGRTSTMQVVRPPFVPSRVR